MIAAGSAVTKRTRRKIRRKIFAKRVNAKAPSTGSEGQASAQRIATLSGTKQVRAPAKARVKLGEIAWATPLNSMTQSSSPVSNWFFIRGRAPDRFTLIFKHGVHFRRQFARLLHFFVRLLGDVGRRRAPLAVAWGRAPAILAHLRFTSLANAGGRENAIARPTASFSERLTWRQKDHAPSSSHLPSPPPRRRVRAQVS